MDPHRRSTSSFFAQPFVDFLPMRRRSMKRPSRKTSPVIPTDPSPKVRSLESGQKSDAQFSTSDRAILEELRRNVGAREAQFVVRGGKKHHAYAAREAPYPRNYERLVLDQ